MKEIILCKYGEIVLKGANKKYFEDMLCREMRKRAKAYGSFDIYRAQSTIYIEPLDDGADFDGMFEAAQKVFGIVTLQRAAVCDKSMDAIAETVRNYIPDFLGKAKTFKVESKRSDKAFPLDSMQISREIGGVVLSCCRGISVDVHNPDIVVKVEIREFGAYVSAGVFKGAGGMPVGSNGRGLLLLSGGIDSPVAGCMMAKRGLEIEALHFESFPYTSERAREKVMQLAQEMCEFCSKIHVHVISLTHIQEELRDNCQEDYFTILLRIFMMRLSERCAREYKCHALITGESLGQVASQTLKAIQVTDSVVNLPVFRPCIGLDKNEIIIQARHYGTFDTSILPFEDCCTVFTPKHPKTQPKIEDVMRELEKVDVEALLDEAYATMYTVTKLVYPEYR